ncbi:signal peptidase II Aspartic peptidase. MEROPS family A08 [Marinococcus luteus]|uniref:Lipoprotein signal peptidase n=1 Tax=Marinococcus luteus TaxID=1122204 RepID=A0A1H2Q7D8_9BACI|nr:signal peptidase II [Marinococcus luteus]SDW03096.1 signal peptidase II Aspartic peptidase. MEROPS family A08 [Marinococcus luteus]
MKIIKWHYLLAALIIIFDQVTKYIVAASMRIGESIEVVPSFLYLTSHRNAGAAFGILQGQRWFFLIITIVVIAVVVYYMQQYGTLSFTFGIPLALVLGGAIGNFIDRMLFGEVVDFVDVYLFAYNYPIFNVADAALTVGVVWLIIGMFLDERSRKKEEAHESTNY